MPGHAARVAPVVKQCSRPPPQRQALASLRCPIPSPLATMPSSCSSARTTCWPCCTTWSTGGLWGAGTPGERLTLAMTLRALVACLDGPPGGRLQCHQCGTGTVQARNSTSLHVQRVARCVTWCARMVDATRCDRAVHHDAGRSQQPKTRHEGSDVDDNDGGAHST